MSDIVVGVAIVQAAQAERVDLARQRIAAEEQGETPVGYRVESMAPGIANLPLEAIAEGPAVRSRQAGIIRPSGIGKVRNDTETRIWSSGWKATETAGGVSIHFQIP